MTKFSAAQQNQLAQIGAFLRDNREKQEKSLEDIAIRTYIRPLLLNGIETGNPELLPEPIFVQGFIRRYAEALGINGIELAQQFTVNSIPSTPRPARQPASTDSSGTTRISKVTAHQPTTNQQTTSQQTTSATPMFSTIGTPPPASPSVPDMQKTAEIDLGNQASTPNVNLDIEPDIELNIEPDIEPDIEPELEPEIEPELEPEIEFDTSFIIDNDRMSGVSMDTAPENEPEVNIEAPPAALEDTVTILNSEQRDSAQANLTQTDIDSLDIERTETTPPDMGAAGTGKVTTGDASIDPRSLTPPTSQNIDDIFASEVAALNQDDIAQSSLNLGPSNPNNSDFNSPSARDNTESAHSIPTAAAATQTTSPKTSESLRDSRSTSPVGVELKSSRNASNLQPFILGGVLAAALTAGIVILFGFLGGRDRQPNIADSPDPAEQVIETAPPLDSGTFTDNASGTTSPATPSEIVPPPPPVSNAPVYVEAKATSEAWVSITVDDNPIPIFEGTLEPGETQLWEAQKNIIVYAGDAGALELAANGNEAEVMGEPGQPTEKIFP